MARITSILIGIPICITMLVGWFAWSAVRTAGPLAAENLRGAGLSIATAIEQLVVVDPSFRTLARYGTPDITYYILIDRQGVIRYHTNPELIGQRYESDEPAKSRQPVAEWRQRLGTGEEVYLLQTSVHGGAEEYRLLLALHTYRAEQVLLRSRTGVGVVAALTVGLWGLTGVLLFMFRREEQHRKDMQRREELARLGELGAVMAHEIRNPLAGIKGYAQLIETADSVAQAQAYAEKVVTQSIRMEALVNDLLVFAREESIERQSVDLALLVRDCVMLAKMEADSSLITICHTPQPELRAMIDTDRITQLLLNLLRKALQAMSEGGELAVELAHYGAAAVIRISDSGDGIPQEHLARIFEPFWTSKASGTGLGLALCRKVAQEHGGTIAVESIVGSGTTFTVTIPHAG
jgi:two-component system sensor histidine kinase HydH